MVRADSTSTTRRNFVRLASAGAAVILSTPAIAVSEANVLIDLALRLDQTTLDINAAADRGDEAAVQMHYRVGSALVDEIFEYEAETIPEAQAKCRALLWIHGDRAEEWDCPHCFDLVRDLLAITAQIGR